MSSVSLPRHTIRPVTDFCDDSEISRQTFLQKTSPDPCVYCMIYPFIREYWESPNVVLDKASTDPLLASGAQADQAQLSHLSKWF